MAVGSISASTLFGVYGKRDASQTSGNIKSNTRIINTDLPQNPTQLTSLRAKLTASATTNVASPVLNTYKADATFKLAANRAAIQPIKVDSDQGTGVVKDGNSIRTGTGPVYVPPEPPQSDEEASIQPIKVGPGQEPGAPVPAPTREEYSTTKSIFHAYNPADTTKIDVTTKLAANTTSKVKLATTEPVSSQDVDETTIQPIKVGPGQSPVDSDPIILVVDPSGNGGGVRSPIRGTPDPLGPLTIDGEGTISHTPIGTGTTTPVTSDASTDKSAFFNNTRPIRIGGPIQAIPELQLPVDGSKAPIYGFNDPIPSPVGAVQSPDDTTKVDVSTVKQSRPPLRGGPVGPLTPLPEKTTNLESIPKQIDKPIIVSTDLPKPQTSFYAAARYDQPISLYPVDEVA